jgi:hypothetical protein
MQGILALLAVIPKLIDLAVRLGEQIRAHEFDQWLQDVDASIKQLEGAKSPEEKRGAALAISRIIAGRRK